MRLYPSVAASLLLVVTTISTSFASDDLFSGVAIESVFNSAGSAEATDAKSSLDTTTRLTDAESVLALLQSAGLEAKKATSKRVETKLKQNGWSLPVAVQVDVDQDLILATMTLVKLEDSSSLNASKLLQLLTVNYGENKSYFAYNADDKKLQVRHQLSNRGLTAVDLLQTLREMADLAISRQSLWTSAKEASSPKVATTKSTQIPTGVWVASISADEAFAIRLDADQSFKLVHVKGKQETTSTGKMSLSGSQIRLTTSDGKSVSGRVSDISSKAFTFQLGGRSLVFKKS